MGTPRQERIPAAKAKVRQRTTAIYEVIMMTTQFRRIAFAAAVLLFLLPLGGCFRIRPIQKPEDPVTPEPVPVSPAETEPDPTPVPPEETEPEPEPLPPEEITIDEALLANAVALGIAGNGAQYIEEPDGLWNVIGWYAALTGRVGGTEAWLSEGTCERLVSILRPAGDPIPIPERWLSGGISREVRGGRPGILFADYETLLGETLGIWRELSQTEENGTRVVTVTDHLEDGTETFQVYTAFETDPNDGISKLVYLFLTDPIREQELNFTLDMVREQNRISNLLSIYSSVTVDMSDEYGTSYQCFWLKDGERVFYEVDETVWEDGEGNPASMHSESGDFRGISFNTYLAAEPTAYLWVTASPEDHTNAEYFENFISSYIPENGSVTEGPFFILDSEDTVSFGVTENYQPPDVPAFDIHHVYTVDKGTLAILEYHMDYVAGDGSAYEGGFSVSYNGEKLGEDVMKAWDSPRTVTFDIKTEAGERTEAVKVPDGWFLQLLTDEGVTVFSDAALKELTYNYVENGTGDITLYARDEANIPTAQTADPSAVTLEDLINANFVTTLTNQYDQIEIDEAYPYGTSKTFYYRLGGEVALYVENDFQFEDGPFQSRQGYFSDINYELGANGDVLLAAYPAIYEGQYQDEEQDAYMKEILTDKNGEYFSGNTYLTGLFFEGGRVAGHTEEADTWTFQIDVSYENDVNVRRYLCTVDKQTLAIRSLSEENGEYSYTVKYGGDPAPFSVELGKAMQKTHTVTYHTTVDGKTADFSYRVPTAWPFTFGVYDMTFYKNSDFTGEVDNLVPADEKDYEFWVTNAVG